MLIDALLFGDAPSNTVLTLLPSCSSLFSLRLDFFEQETCVAHPIAAFAFVFSALAGLFYYLSRARKSSGSALPMYSKVSTVKAD